MNRDKVLYFHINPIKNHIFYVGIGNKYRPKVKKGRNKMWQNIVNKYGYIIEVVHTGLTKQEAEEKEIYYIKLFGRRDLGLGNLVNLNDGGNTNSGWIATPESISKRVSKTTGQKRTNECRERMSESQLGHSTSDVTRENMRNSALNKPKPSIKTNKKISISLKKFYSGVKRKPTIQKVINQYDIEGNFIREWSSIKLAADVLGIQRTNISKVLTGKRISTSNYKFKYKV